jgi:SAM-dependent methyltransferase
MDLANDHQELSANPQMLATPQEELRAASRLAFRALLFVGTRYTGPCCGWRLLLEHIQEDRESIRGLFRVLRPGGWAVIGVPIRLDQATFEHPTVTAPEERERAFGETAHVRIYGHDLMDRLEECGFQVQLDSGKDVEQQTKQKNGLRDDENLFYCT